MSRNLPLVLLASALTGCAGTAPQLQTEHAYRVEWIGERPLIDRSHLSITFAADGRAHGNAGCNHWFASYQLDGERLRFESPGSTRRMCAPALMEQEQRFLAALEKVERWDFNSIGQLQLWPVSGKPIRLWAD
ncbi:META domain-containing protein [Pseudomonas sp. NCCP-436]|uniref:META domain-containing protein n=1 Tax=Pseudomonas sp. NCCP-436 TaxID=2842481 RepID=UPI001C7E38EF|nr:META domain-containing protein [Pseudomonas sp. NCCP-436]GIZ13287.1 lipoprotein [Pseudomonas sp. NCCP-436]